LTNYFAGEFMNRLESWHHPNYPLNTGVWEPFCQEVEEKTEGRVKIYFHPGSGSG
jgi:TRAP-type C4-dicarboxylate transport system substrate-binding protein